MTRRWTLPGVLMIAMAASSQAPAERPSTRAGQPAAEGAARTGEQAAPAARKAVPQFPALPGDGKAAQGSPQPSEWTKEEVEAAQAQCATVLAGLGAVTIPAEAMRSGDCGAPAPVELISVGTAPQVTFSPPAVLTCDMVAALDKWFRTDVQPAARSLLGTRIVRVDVMSSYSCRTAYGRRHSRLSEHGRANAIDVRAFLTERGDTIDIQNDWGLTERDIKARIAAARKEAEKQEAARRETERKEAERLAAASAAKARAKQQAGEASQARPFGEALRGAIADQAGPSITLPPVLSGPREPNPLTWTPPSQLGGPKENAPPIYTADPSKPKERFLRRVHGSACQVFGTILGPEANEAHRNHFHIDMAERRSGSYCE